MKKIIYFITILAIITFLISYGFAQIPTIPTGDSNNNDENNQTKTDEGFKGFSGKYIVYSSNDGQYSLKIPEEFKLTDEGLTTYWNTDPINGMAATISVNYVEMPDVSSDVLYNINLDSYKKKTKEYTDIKEVKIRWGKAFRVKEVQHKAGSPSQPKNDDDIHRWHLFVFGNGKSFTCGFTGSLKTFKDNILPPVFEEVINSFKLVK